MPQPEAILYFSYDGPLYDTLFKCEEFVSHLGDPGMHIGIKTKGGEDRQTRAKGEQAPRGPAGDPLHEEISRLCFTRPYL